MTAQLAPAQESVAAPANSGVPRRCPLRKARILPRTVIAALALPIFGGCISEAREQEIGNQMAAEVNPSLPLIRDPVLQAYVETVWRLAT